MADGETMPVICGYAREGDAGFDYVKPFPVLKLTQDGEKFRPGMGYHGRAAHEYVVLLEKGRRRFENENWPDVFAVPWRGDAETKSFTPDGKPYPTAKPAALMQAWVELSTKPGETVCDPFLGGGASAIASLIAGRNFIGVDSSEYALNTTVNRIGYYLGGAEPYGFPPFRDAAVTGIRHEQCHLPGVRRESVPVLDL